MSNFQLQDFDNKDSEEKEVSKIEGKKSCLCQDRLQVIYREESMIKDEIISQILNGKAHTMKPNSGETVQIHESHISLKFYTEEEEREYIVWEWHGHIMRYTHGRGFSPEYINGNYFQRIKPEEFPCV